MVVVLMCNVSVLARAWGWRQQLAGKGALLGSPERSRESISHEKESARLKCDWSLHFKSPCGELE